MADDHFPDRQRPPPPCETGNGVDRSQSPFQQFNSAIQDACLHGPCILNRRRVKMAAVPVSVNSGDIFRRLADAQIWGHDLSKYLKYLSGKD